MIMVCEPRSRYQARYQGLLLDRHEHLHDHRAVTIARQPTPTAIERRNAGDRIDRFRMQPSLANADTAGPASPGTSTPGAATACVYDIRRVGTTFSVCNITPRDTAAIGLSGHTNNFAGVYLDARIARVCQQRLIKLMPIDQPLGVAAKVLAVPRGLPRDLRVRRRQRMPASDVR